MENLQLTSESYSAVDRRVRRLLSRAMGLIVLTGVGILAALVAAFFSMITLGDASWAGLGPGTARLALIGFIPACAWVWVGAQVMRDPRDRLPFAAVLFVAGAFVAWSVMPKAGLSPCHGLVDQLGAYTGGGVGLVLACLARRGDNRSPWAATLLVGLALSLVALTGALARAWMAPQLGDYAVAHIGDDAFGVRLLPQEVSSDTAADSTFLIWAEGSAIERLARTVDEGVLRVQRNFRRLNWEDFQGSAVPADSARPTAERAAEAYMREQIRREIQDGITAPLCARLPLPRADLSDVRFFRIVKASRT